ncbi:MAG: hypothetical protein LBN12_04515 [Clostridiales Family XIII bacterium]|jgi:hypothetical protein|nr:hypothetical protein [Clostridiales Family XIII bacterium]
MLIVETVVKEILVGVCVNHQSGKKRAFLFVTILVIAIAFGACGNSPEEGSGQGDMGKTDGQYGETNPYDETVNSLKDLIPGKDYLENQVVCTEDSKKQAKAVAERIGGDLLSFENGVGVIAIPGTVADLMQRLADEKETEFIVSPNFIYSLNLN